MASHRKVPTLNGDTNYAQFGSWESDLQAYLSRHDMQLWSSLEEAKMPDGYPPEVEEGTTEHADYVAMTAMFLISSSESTGLASFFTSAASSLDA